MNAVSLSTKTGSGKWRLYPIGDLHWDKRSFDERRFVGYLKLIAKDPCGIWILLGDMIDGTTPDHRFYKPSTIKPTVIERMQDYVRFCQDELEKLLNPLKKMPGVVIEGNHDVRGGLMWAGFAPELARRLNAQFGGSEAIIRVMAHNGVHRGDNAWVIHAHHGAGGGYAPGGKVTRFQNTVTHIADADIFLRGHVHDSDARILCRYTINHRGDPYIVQRPIAYLTAPAFLKQRQQGVNDYAGERGLPPGDDGIIYLEIANPVGSIKRNNACCFGRIRRIEADL